MRLHFYGMRKSVPAFYLTSLHYSLILSAVFFMSVLPREVWGLEARSLEIDAALGLLGYYIDDLPWCEHAPENTCQDKSAGGHPGTIFATVDGQCAKKIRSPANVKEVAFYSKMTKLCQGPQPEPLCGFLPQFGGLCQEGGDVYVKMQNLKESFIEPTSGEVMARALDLKIGRYTYSAAAMHRSHVSNAKIASSLVFRTAQDSLMTSSGRMGFRFAGVSGQLEKGMAPGNMFDVVAFYLEPRRALSRFFEAGSYPQVQACLYQKMLDLQDAVEQSSFEKYHLIGASVFMLYDPTPHSVAPTCELYLIDFANSMIVNPSQSLYYSHDKHGKFVDSFRQGIARLTSLLEPKA